MKDLLRLICDEARKKGAAFADARVFESDHTGIVRQDGRADKLDQGSTNGLGIRVLKDAAWGFASVSNFDRNSALAALDSAVAMAHASAARSEEARVAHLPAVEHVEHAHVEIDPRTVPVEKKMAALAEYERAATAADGAGVTVDWVCADMTTVPPAVGEYDLVSVQYPALRRSPDDEVIRSLLDAVAPDGTILVVGHGPESHEYARAHGFEPADYIEPADVAARLDESWSIEVNETRPRSTAPRPDSPFRQDVVLRARRRPIR